MGTKILVVQLSSMINWQFSVQKFTVKTHGLLQPYFAISVAYLLCK